MGPKSLENILSQFTKAATDLESFQARAVEESDRMSSEAEQLRLQAEDKRAEADKAERVRSNILAILEG